MPSLPPDRAAVAADDRQGPATDDQFARRAQRHFLSTAQRWSVALSAIGVPALADALLCPISRSRTSLTAHRIAGVELCLWPARMAGDGILLTTVEHSLIRALVSA